ncbi:MAG: penicillin-binding protein activator [Alphaproteobacteria bacterium]|nr:penicillin-binding protein activator [Alphaproteobacteria bacterium]
MVKPLCVVFLFLLASCADEILPDRGEPSQSTISTPRAAQTVVQPRPTPQSPAYRYQSGVPRPQDQQVQAQAKATPVQAGARIALLLPLSGRQGPLGQAMANAAQMAVFDMGVTGFELMPRDTKGTPQGAVKAAQEAISSGAQLIIGPLFAADVAAVKPVVINTPINMLALSTDMSLGENGAYMMGFAPAPQVERVVSYALSRGLTSFAAIVPINPYGDLVGKAFREAVQRGGGTIVAFERGERTTEILAQKDRIQALFLPLGGTALRNVVTALSDGGMVPGTVQILGTGLWDEPNVAQGLPLLVGGWYAAPEPELRTRFVSGYESSFGQAAPRLATLAYDATAMAAVLARNGMGYSRPSLTLSSGFAGVDGVFRLLPTGQIERALAVNELDETGSHVVDPSPQNFRR